MPAGSIPDIVLGALGSFPGRQNAFHGRPTGPTPRRRAINLGLQSAKRPAAPHEVARLLDSHPDVLNSAGFDNERLARERLDSTSIGDGIALPHARTEYVKQNLLAIGRSDQGMFFEN